MGHPLRIADYTPESCKKTHRKGAECAKKSQRKEGVVQDFLCVASARSVMLFSLMQNLQLTGPGLLLQTTDIQRDIAQPIVHILFGFDAPM